MSKVLERKVRALELDRLVEECAAVVDLARGRNRRRLLGTFAGLAVATIIGVLRGWVALPYAIVGSIVVLVVINRSGAIKRKAAKVEFVRALLAGASADLHPRGRLKLKLDLHPYDHATKIAWTGRSSAGNVKKKFSDDWLELDLVLVDRTHLHLRQQVGVKTKKGSIVKEKRRLFLTLRPGPRYDWARAKGSLESLRHDLKAAVARHFQNPPEDFHVHFVIAGSTLRIEVAQEDAPILAAELLALIGEVMGFLARFAPEDAGAPRP